MAIKQIATRNPQYAEPGREHRFVQVSEESIPESGTVWKLRLLWEGRRSLLRSAGIGLAAATVLAFVIPPRYTTTTRLMPPDQTGHGIASVMAALGKTSDLGSIGTELLGVKTSSDVFLGVLKSETVENALVNKFDLRRAYWKRRWVDARKKLEDRTDISADRKSGIITVKVTDNSPARAAEMGREYVEQLNRVVTTLDTSSAHRERVFLETRLNEVKQDLESAEQDFSQFASKNATLDVKEQGRAMIGAAAELQGELIAAQTQLEGLRQIYTANNVRVRSLQARIDEYQRQLQKLGGHQVEAGAQPTGGTEGDLYPSIRQLPILGVTWADLYRRTKVEEVVFETLTKQYELARVEEAREVPSIKVLDIANVPEKRSFPPRTVIIVSGACLGLAFGSAWMLGKARWREIDDSSPGKKLATEVGTAISATAGSVTRRFFARRVELNNSSTDNAL